MVLVREPALLQLKSHDNFCGNYFPSRQDLLCRLLDYFHVSSYHHSTLITLLNILFKQKIPAEYSLYSMLSLIQHDSSQLSRWLLVPLTRVLKKTKTEIKWSSRVFQISNTAALHTAGQSWSTLDKKWVQKQQNLLNFSYTHLVQISHTFSYSHSLTIKLP